MAARADKYGVPPQTVFLTGLSLAAAMPFGLTIVAIRFSSGEGAVWTVMLYFWLLIGWIAGWLAAVLLQRFGKIPPFWAGLLLPLAGMALWVAGLMLLV